MAERVEDIGEPLLDHYLRTLVAVRLPACEILGQADAQGVDSQALCRIARALLPSLPAAADPDLAALCLALGSARNWRTLKAKVYRFREAFPRRQLGMCTSDN